MDNSKIVLKCGISRIDIKKSIFIGNIKCASTADDAISIINAIKKEHYKATHNCSAYIVDNGNIHHQSDDGEPQGTAGKPMLEVLRGSNLINVVAVVTRYFGGTLLGTGGLVRAYTQCIKEALKNTKIADKLMGVQCKFKIPYTFVGKIKHIIEENQINILDEIYDSCVTMNILSSKEINENFIKKCVDLTAGQLQILSENIVDYISYNNEITIIT